MQFLSQVVAMSLLGKIATTNPTAVGNSSVTTATSATEKGSNII
jgi:hypothetical protein